jgi:hypothetical protein
MFPKSLCAFAALMTSSYGFRSRDLYIIALFGMSMQTEPSCPVHEEIRNWSAATSPSRTIILKMPLIMTPEMKYCESLSENTGKLEKKEQKYEEAKPDNTIARRDDASSRGRAMS